MLRKINLELLFSIMALLYLATINPAAAHVSLCPVKNFGFDWCPGCGLGHAISYIFHGEIEKSWNSHPLGWFAIIVITHRIITLSKTLFKP